MVGWTGFDEIVTVAWREVEEWRLAAVAVALARALSLSRRTTRFGRAVCIFLFLLGHGLAFCARDRPHWGALGLKAQRMQRGTLVRRQMCGTQRGILLADDRRLDRSREGRMGAGGSLGCTSRCRVHSKAPS